MIDSTQPGLTHPFLTQHFTTHMRHSQTRDICEALDTLIQPNIPQTEEPQEAPPYKDHTPMH